MFQLLVRLHIIFNYSDTPFSFFKAYVRGILFFPRKSDSSSGFKTTGAKSFNKIVDKVLATGGPAILYRVILLKKVKKRFNKRFLPFFSRGTTVGTLHTEYVTTSSRALLWSHTFLLSRIIEIWYSGMHHVEGCLGPGLIFSIYGHSLFCDNAFWTAVKLAIF